MRRSVLQATDGQRRAGRGLLRAVQDAARGAARGPRPHRHQARLRARRVRRLRGAGRRRAAAFLPGARARMRRAARSRPSRAWRAAPQLHPLQAAFADLGAAQCGYCTPGHADDGEGAARAGTRIPAASRIKEAIAGNLCRCTGYQQIFEAIEEAAGSCARRRSEEALRSHRQAAPPRRRPRQGHRRRRASPTTSCCRACCTRKLLRSPHPHALIETIDVEKAKSASRRASGAHRQGFPDHRSASCRSSQDEYPLAPRARALRRRPGRGGDREGRADRGRSARPDRGAVQAAEDHRRIPRRRCRTPSRASTTTASRATSIALQSYEFGDVEEVAGEVGSRVRGPVLLRRQHAPADRAAGRARRRSTAKAS